MVIILITGFAAIAIGSIVRAEQFRRCFMLTNLGCLIANLRAIAPKSIIPSIPRLRIPERSVKISPIAAKSNTVPVANPACRIIIGFMLPPLPHVRCEFDNVIEHHC